MKKILQKITLLILTLVCTGTIVTLAQIPNNDFEFWNNMGLGGENPNDWYTSNGDLVPSNVFKDSITKYSGNYSVLLTNVIGIPGSIGINFPITNHPFQLKGYFKSEFLSADTASIKIILFNNTQRVDSGEYFITTSLLNWTNIAITISNSTATVNSATINITACNQQQNKCWIDLLSLEEPNSVTEFNSSDINLFPNPSDNKIYFEGLKNISALTIYDLTGRVIRNFAGKNQSTYFIDVADLSNGIYSIEMESEGKFYRKNFVKE